MHASLRQGEFGLAPPNSIVHTGSTALGDTLGAPDGPVVGLEEGDGDGMPVGPTEGLGVGCSDVGAVVSGAAKARQPSLTAPFAAVQNVTMATRHAFEAGWALQLGS